jgi:hypothetical protein
MPAISMRALDPLPGQTIGQAREQRVTIDQVEQRHRLAAHAVDNTAVVDDVTMPSLGLAAAAAQGQRQALADEAFQPIVIETHPHAKADQPRGNGVEHFSQHEAAARGHEHRGLVVVGGSSRWQRAQRGALQLHHLAATRVAPADQVGDPDTIGIEALEIDAARPSGTRQQKGRGLRPRPGLK